MDTIGFFAFSLPETQNKGSKREVIWGEGIMRTGLHKGFVIKPFLPETPYYTIISEFNKLTDGLDSKFEEYFGKGRQTGIRDRRPATIGDEPSESTSKEDYIIGARHIIDVLKKGACDKIVYSRLIQKEAGCSAYELFNRLCGMYPWAYVFAFHTRATGSWIGASPELLMEATEGNLHTMALAGTLRADSKEHWDLKNREEHNMVVRYIDEILSRYFTDCSISPTTEKPAGPVRHLLTHISSSIHGKHVDIEQFLREFSPSPALAGLPKSRAIEEIVNTEKHTRDCYGGFAGPCIDESNFTFFVNLRSIKWRYPYCNLYVGGGLTPLSDPETEWNETEMKAKTLCDCLSE